jgi:hypothetical protein
LVYRQGAALVPPAGQETLHHVAAPDFLRSATRSP